MEGLRRKEGLGMSMLYCFLKGFRLILGLEMRGKEGI